MTRIAPGRIAIVVPAFPKLSETFIVTKVLGLLRRGWDVHVVCSASDRREWERIPALHEWTSLRERVHVAWSARSRPLATLGALSVLLRRPLTGVRYLKEGELRKLVLDATLAALRPDVIHFEFGSIARGRMHLGRRLDCRVVTSFRGFDLNFVGLGDPHYYDDVWQHADAIHVLGEDLWDRARRRGCPASKAHAIIPAAVDTDFFSPLWYAMETGRQLTSDSAARPVGPLRIVSVGRLVWEKGYEYALEAVASFKRRDIPFTYMIIGGGDYLEALAFARYQMGLEGEVSFVGALPPDAVRERLDGADIFLHAAVSEGFCNAALEAQAMALPVVASDAGGLRENVADGETGYIVPRRDAAALADRLAELASDPGLRKRMGEAGRQRVVRHFRVEEQTDRFDAFYRDVLTGLVPERTVDIAVTG